MEAWSCKGKSKGACKGADPLVIPQRLDDDGKYVEDADDYSDPPSDARVWSGDESDSDTVRITLSNGMTGEVIYSDCWQIVDPVTAGHFIGIVKTKLQAPETSIALAIGTRCFDEDSMYSKILLSKIVRSIIAAQDGREKVLNIQVILKSQVG